VDRLDFTLTIFARDYIRPPSMPRMFAHKSAPKSRLLHQMSPHRCNVSPLWKTIKIASWVTEIPAWAYALLAAAENN